MNCAKKTPYATEIGVHKASTEFKMKNDDFQSIFQLSVCAHTPHKQLGRLLCQRLNMLCKLECERKSVIFLVFQQRLITAKYWDLSALDFRY